MENVAIGIIVIPDGKRTIRAINDWAYHDPIEAKPLIGLLPDLSGSANAYIR